MVGGFPKNHGIRVPVAANVEDMKGIGLRCLGIPSGRRREASNDGFSGLGLFSATWQSKYAEYSHYVDRGGW